MLQPKSMIRKSGYRFSEKIMLQPKTKPQLIAASERYRHGAPCPVGGRQAGQKSWPCADFTCAAHRFAVQIFVQSQTHLSADVATESGQIGFVDFPHHACRSAEVGGREHSWADGNICRLGDLMPRSASGASDATANVGEIQNAFGI
ncbi:MAG: hypothetical protein WAL37_21000 [Xanthobacteraceae bacterium]